jgi:DTW domain-containing protein YfiP
MELTLASSTLPGLANPHKRKRARQACDHCRAKKIRCMCHHVDTIAAIGFCRQNGVDVMEVS